MRVLVAGGTGFIGSALVRALRGDGHSVTVLTRNPDKARLPDGVRAAGWDARSPAGWGHLIEETDAVVNLVGENLGGGLWTAKRKQRIRDSRINAGRAISQAIQAARQRPAVLVQSSGIGYYGFSGDTFVDEASPAGSDWLAQVSVAWEDSTRAVEDLGVRRVVARNALVLHGREGIFPLVLLPFRLFVGGPIGSGRQWFPWIHLDDAVQATLFLIKNQDASGVYNFSAPDPVTNDKLGKTIARVMRRPYYFPVPAIAMKTVLGELSTLVLEGQRAVPARLQELGYIFRFPTMEGALIDLLR